MNSLLRSRWASLRRCHLLGALAEEGVFKLHRHDSQFGWLKLIKDVLSIIGAVIVTDACMVAPNNEVSTAIILANQGVENRFSRPSIAHGGWINCQNYSVFWKVKFHHNLVATHPHLS